MPLTEGSEGTEWPTGAKAGEIAPFTSLLLELVIVFSTFS